jgi:two-component system sensor histidine kinase RegB
MAVVIGELEREACLDAEAREDLALVREQIALCKGIISSMAARAGTLRPEQVQVQDARVWLEGVRARWHTLRPRATSRLTLKGAAGVPRIVTEATLEQALANVLNNAADASDAEIEIRLDWDESKLRIVVKDGGPGFPSQVPRQAGRVPLSTRNGGAGIGLLLAFSAVERFGGRIVLDNPLGGGGQVSIELPVASQAEK